MTDLQGTVIRGTQGGYGNQSAVAVALNTLGEQVVMDWIQKAVMDGMVYQVRAGTITAPLTGDVAITDTAAEMAADAATGTTIIPVRLGISLESLNGGTVPEFAAKSVATVSSSGTAFTPLNLRSDGAAAASTARVQAAGSVTVTAELATTTLRHAEGAIATVGTGLAGFQQNFLPAPVLVGPRCFYVQVAGVTAGPLYFADFDYVEAASTLVTL